METITLDRKKQQRAQVMGQLMAGRITTAEAASVLGLAIRTVERLRPGFRSKGPSALIHGNQGRRPANRTPDTDRTAVLELARGACGGFTFEHLADMVEEVLRLTLSADTVRRICNADGISAPHPQRRRRPRRERRERCAQEGEMLQIDGSTHDWLEGRGPKLTLINMIDDATGRKWSRFFEGETLEGYMTVLRQVILNCGVPMSVYSDGISTVHGGRRYRQEISEKTRAQLKRALQELGAVPILAGSAQAKGRVERTHGTDQDRLVSILRYHGASTLDEANVALAHHLRQFHRKFTHPAANPTPAWILRPSGRLDDILCIKEERVVSRDNTVQVYGRVIDIPAGSPRRDYAGRRVDIHRRFDGSLGIHLEGRRIAGTPPRPLSIQQPRPTKSLRS